MSRHTRVYPRRSITFGYGAITHFGGTFQILHLIMLFVTPLLSTRTEWDIPQPLECNDLPLDTLEVWAIPRSLAATSGIVFTFFSGRY